MRKKRFVLALIILIPVIAIAVAFYSLAINCVYTDVQIELGSNAPSADDFSKYKIGKFSFVTNDLNMDVAGDYELVVKGPFWIKHNIVLHVRDWAAPEIIAKDVEAYFNDESMAPKASDFIEKITDASDFTWWVEDASGKRIDTFLDEGEFSFNVVAEDEYGNRSSAPVKGSFTYDTTPPIIEGVKELTTKAGKSISYKNNINVIDDYDESPELSVDTSEVNLKLMGTYKVVYTAKDKAGNIATEVTKIVVTAPEVDGATEDIVYQKADEVLAKIITNNMSDYQKAEAIFWWCYNNITYLEGTPNDEWVKGAYRGLFDHKGDCSVSRNTAKCLLTRAGIANKDIDRDMSGGGYNHYWNLINIGEGWYHFDTMVNVFNTPIFYWSDVEMHYWAPGHWNMHKHTATQCADIVQERPQGANPGTPVPKEEPVSSDLGDE